MEAVTQPGYDDRLYFHVYDHALDTRAQARELGKWAAYNGLDVDFYVLDWAAIGHDFGFYEWTFLSGEEKALYPSREKYAAHKVEAMMQELGAPEEKIQGVKEAIWSTEKGVECTTLEGKILRQADLQNVGTDNPKSFIFNTIKLYREKRLFDGKSPRGFNLAEFISFGVNSYPFLVAYNEEDVSLGDFDREANGQSSFRNVADKQIRMLLPDQIYTLLHHNYPRLFQIKEEVDSIDQAVS